MNDSLWLARIVAVAVGAFAGLCLGSIAAGLVLGLAYIRGQVRASRNWLATPGTITAASGRLKSTRGNSNYYYPVVSYTYDVDGRSFIGPRIAFGLPDSSAHSTREQAAAQFPLGGTVRVYYNPRNPADSVLERREANITLWVIALIVFVLAATVPIGMTVAGLVAMESGG